LLYLSFWIKSNGERLPELLKSFFQMQSEVVFVASGSVRHMIEELLFKDSGVLYHSCLKLDIKSMVPEDESVEYIVRKFVDTGKDIDEVCAKRIYTSTRGHPYFVQMLSYEVWNRTEVNVTMEDVENAIDYLCDRESYGYDLIIEALDYKYLKNVLKLIGENDGGYFSNSNLLAYEIPNTSALNRLLKRLTEQGIIEKTGRGKYQIIDPLFERYVNKVLV